MSSLLNATNGVLSAQYEYGPFGEVLRSSGTASKANPCRFSTKYQDDESDSLYYGYRYYNRSTGRWLNRDPINEPGFNLLIRSQSPFNSGEEKNLYGFVRNNPVVFYDSDGLKLGPNQRQYFVLQGIVGVAAALCDALFVPLACKRLQDGEEMFIATPNTRLLSIPGSLVITLKCPNGGVLRYRVWKEYGSCKYELVVLCFGGSGGA